MDIQHGGTAHPVDFEMIQDYFFTHPTSLFKHNLVASAFTKEGFVNIVNQYASVIRPGAPQAAYLADRKALRQFVAQHFGFDLPDLETIKVDGVPSWQ